MGGGDQTSKQTAVEVAVEVGREEREKEGQGHFLFKNTGGFVFDISLIMHMVS
jgi:hypothetical protein